MCFLIENDDLFKKYNTIWDEVSADIKKELFYNKSFLKTKIKSYSDQVTEFYDKEIPKIDFNHTCLAVIILDSALKKDDNFILPSVFKSLMKNKSGLSKPFICKWKGDKKT